MDVDDWTISSILCGKLRVSGADALMSQGCRAVATAGGNGSGGAVSVSWRAYWQRVFNAAVLADSVSFAYSGNDFESAAFMAGIL
ncbi:MAG: hypothetical protein JXR76_24230 [Deltaproteobacteria bacterium]|nr:hypothetical protein [Deltaproteobacteria bacterium]